MHHEQCACSEEYEFLPRIGAEVPDFHFEYFHNNAFHKNHLAAYRKKWIILFFYPGDFTFVCPTELEELGKRYADFKKLGAEILSVSTDSVYVHKAWHDHSKAIKSVSYPMISDRAGLLCRAFGVYIDEVGEALRGSFIIDPDGILQACEIHANNIGRNAAELYRKLEAAQFVRKHGSEVCPANWTPGAKTLKPGVDLVGKI